MNKMTNEHWPTVIVINGKPYQLKELNRQGINNPCSLCDLRWLCDNEKEQGFIDALCTSDDRNDAWFFEEDWTIVSKQIIEFVEAPMKRQLELDIENVVKNETHKELEA